MDPGRPVWVSGFRDVQPGLLTVPLVALMATGSFAVGQPAFARPSGRPGRRTQLTCYPIRSGDTAARLALRFTGSADNRYESWFQIVDPTTAALIPKSRYGVIQAGWHVCLATDAVRREPARPHDPLASSSPTILSQAGATAEERRIDPPFLLWGALVFIVGSGLVLAWAWKGLDERRARVDVMKVFGDRFISEFERPLCRGTSGPSIKSRLRFVPRRRRLEILLAPGDGRTYPNLADHRKNVEYDVARVLRLLRHEPFVSGPLYAEGTWVVIPCRLYTDRQ